MSEARRAAVDTAATDGAARPPASAPGVDDESEPSQQHEREAPGRGVIAWLQRRTLAQHAAALLILVVAMAFAVQPSKATLSDDDALYGRQVLALRAGHWDWRYPGASVDPKGEWVPFSRGDRVSGKYYPYIRHPAYVLLLYGAVSMFGLHYGLVVVSMLGFVLAAVMAWLLANEIDARAGPFAFGLVAASPLLTNALLPWAHTTSAALAGAALLVAVRIVRDGFTWRRVVALAAFLSGGLLVRSEMALFAVALAIATAGSLGLQLAAELAAERRKGSREEGRKRAAPLRAAVIVAVVGVVVFATLALEQRMVSRITTTPSSGVVSTSGAAAVRAHTPAILTDPQLYVEKQFHALVRITFAASRRSVDAALPILFVVALLVAALALWPRIARSRHSRVILTAIALGVFGLYAWRMVIALHNPIPGLLAAWPVVLLGFLALPWDRTTPLERMLALTAALFALAVYATQYDVGGGAEWGGRFLSPAVVGLAVVVAVGVRRGLVMSAPLAARQGVALVVTVLIISSALAGPLLLGTDRDLSLANNRDLWPLVEVIEERATSTVVITAVPLTVLSSVGWRLEAEGFQFFRAWADSDRLIDALYEAGTDELTVILSDGAPFVTPPYPHVEDVTPPWMLATWDARMVILRR